MEEEKQQHSRYFTDQFDNIAHEVSKLAIACDIDFFAEGVAERILDNDDSVCGTKNPRAFEEIRQHLMALFPLETRAMERVGIEETAEILTQVRESIRRLRNAGKPQN